MAGSQYGRPVIVGDGSKPVILEPIPLSGNETTSYNERWLQELVFDNPELLPIDQIDNSYEGLVPVCMELNTPSGPIDALYVTPKGKLIVMEAKLWRNHEGRRKVVAQILDYAQALSGWSYENLLKEVRRTTKRSGNALWDIVSERTGEVNEQAFNDGVSKSLRTSEFLLLIVGDGIREGAGAIANFLEDTGRFNFTFGLVEMAIFDFGDGRRLVQPRVLAQTVLIERPRGVSTSSRTIQLEQDKNADDGEADSKELTVREAACRDFWTAFRGQLKLDDVSQPHPNVWPLPRIEFTGPPKSNSWFTARTGAAGSDRASVQLTFTRGPVADSIFRILSTQSEDIDKEIGMPMKWDSKDGKHTVTTEKQFSGDVLSADRRAEVIAYLSDALNRFVNSFRERIGAAVAATA